MDRYNDNEWRYRSLLTCGLAVVDSRLPIDPISLGFVEVPADAAQGVVSKDADDKPRIEGRVLLPDTLKWSQGEWHVRLPHGRYAAVFGAREDLKTDEADGSVLIFRVGDTVNVAQVETAIPAFYQATFFFDEADALFGKSSHAADLELILRLELADQS